MTDVKCFWLEPTGETRYSLRRYVSSTDKVRACRAASRGGLSYCNAHAPLGVLTEEPEKPSHDDPRWPTSCDACKQPFVKDDAWQVFPEALYRRADTGEVTTLRAAPAGAMWDATWMREKGPDGRSLVLRVVDGWDWMIDGPASNGPGWTRSGEPPHITARPSIGVPGPGGWRYHGWLTDGVLRPC